MREPDKAGVARAWRVDQTDAVRDAHVREFGYPSTSVGPTWLVHGPYHPLWSWWYIGCVSLRDVEGIPPANKRYPEAEYELMILSLNPEPEPPRPSVPDLDKIAEGDMTLGMPGFLTPPDVAFQFDGLDETQVAAVLELVVDHIVAGRSCDSDFRAWWEHALAETIKHYKAGVH